MKFRCLHLEQFDVTADGPVYLVKNGDDTGIGEVYQTRNPGGCVVIIYAGHSPAAYGLDAARTWFGSMGDVRTWASDDGLTGALAIASRMSTVDVQRLRGALADVITKRTAFEVVR